MLIKTNIKIYEYEKKYCQETIKLFRDTVHNINKLHYTKEQLNTWAPENINENEWNDSLLKNISVVAISDGVIVGFGDISPNGYFNRLFTNYKYQNNGVATKICNYLEKKVNKDVITADVSITAKLFFEKRGYIVTGEQIV